MGATIFLGFRMRNRGLPIPFVIRHRLIAITGYVFYSTAFTGIDSRFGLNDREDLQTCVATGVGNCICNVASQRRLEKKDNPDISAACMQARPCKMSSHHDMAKLPDTDYTLRRAEYNCSLPVLKDRDGLI